MSSSGSSSTPVSPISLTTVAASVVMSNKLASSDANPAFQIKGDGTLQWGAGGAGALDTNLYRASAGVLKSDNEVDVGAVTKIQVNQITTGAIRCNGSGSSGFLVTSSGTSILDAGWSVGGQLGFYGVHVAQPATYTLHAGATSRDLPSGATLAQVEAALRQIISDLSAANGGNGLVA